jgi:hypothetical protein
MVFTVLQLESVQRELDESKCLALKYENDIILLKETLETPQSPDGE